jgi:hypothetical protein
LDQIIYFPISYNKVQIDLPNYRVFTSSNGGRHFSVSAESSKNGSGFLGGFDGNGFLGGFDGNGFLGGFDGNGFLGGFDGSGSIGGFDGNGFLGGGWTRARTGWSFSFNWFSSGFRGGFNSCWF